MKCRQNGEIVIEVEISICLTVQNIRIISSNHFPWARVGARVIEIFWERALLLS